MIKTPDMEAAVIVALGGNLLSRAGAPDETLRAALRDMSAAGVAPIRISRFYETPCFPAGAGPDYVNAVAVCGTPLSPEGVLEVLHRIEESYGRERETRWSGRTLDLDLLAFGQRVSPDPETARGWMDLPLDAQRERTPDRLVLPHPRIQDRGFVLIPLLDVAPDWVHPILQKSVRDMADALSEDEKSGIKAL